jgi:hypothetical protein
LTVAAMAHLKAHGNINVLEKLYHAIATVFGVAAHKKWTSYIVAHSWLVHNPSGMDKRKLRDAAFASIMVKDKASPKELDIDAIRANHWWDFEVSADDAKPVNAAVYATKLTKRTNDMLKSGLIVGADGKPVTLGELRTLLRTAIEALEAPHVTVETPVAAKAEPVRLITGDEAVKVTRKAKAAKAA